MDTNPTVPTPVTVTERAAARLNELAAGEERKQMLRVTVEGGGCSGFQYKFALVDTRDADDVAIERDGATVLVDTMSVPFMLGSEIDFVDDLIGATFRVTNPLATAACGCGTSFSI